MESIKEKAQRIATAAMKKAWKLYHDNGYHCRADFRICLMAAWESVRMSAREKWNALTDDEIYCIIRGNILKANVDHKKTVKTFVKTEIMQAEIETFVADAWMVCQKKIDADTEGTDPQLIAYHAAWAVLNSYITKTKKKENEKNVLFYGIAEDSGDEEHPDFFNNKDVHSLYGSKTEDYNDYDIEKAVESVLKTAEELRLYKMFRDGYNIREIAEKLGISRSTTQRRLQKMKEKLKVACEKQIA